MLWVSSMLCYSIIMLLWVISILLLVVVLNVVRIHEHAKSHAIFFVRSPEYTWKSPRTDRPVDARTDNYLVGRLPRQWSIAVADGEKGEYHENLMSPTSKGASIERFSTIQSHHWHYTMLDSTSMKFICTVGQVYPRLNERERLMPASFRFAMSRIVMWPLLLTWFNFNPTLYQECNYFPGIVWGEITYPFLNFNGATVEV